MPEPNRNIYEPVLREGEESESSFLESLMEVYGSSNHYVDYKKDSESEGYCIHLNSCSVLYNRSILDDKEFVIITGNGNMPNRAKNRLEKELGQWDLEEVLE
jgi:hypothetical protein